MATADDAEHKNKKKNGRCWLSLEMKLIESIINGTPSLSFINSKLHTTQLNRTYNSTQQEH